MLKDWNRDFVLNNTDLVSYFVLRNGVQDDVLNRHHVEVFDKRVTIMPGYRIEKSDDGNPVCTIRHFSLFINEKYTGLNNPSFYLKVNHEYRPNQGVRKILIDEKGDFEELNSLLPYILK